MSMRCRKRGCDGLLRPSQILCGGSGWFFCETCKSYTRLEEEEEEAKEAEEAPTNETGDEKRETVKPSCAEHSKYGVERKPRRNCPSCWEAYREKWPDRIPNPEPGVCEEHPRYTAARKPRRDCKQCWAAYEERWPERI